MSATPYNYRIYGTETVLEAARRRIAWLFDEFENVLVPVSGGKDSTVVLNLALEVAQAKGRLPLDVMFLDQEVEFDSTIDMIREIADDTRVRMHWLQVPFRLSNQANSDNPWLNCWGPGERWMRAKEPDAIHENTYGTDRFYPLFDAFTKALWPDEPCVRLAGIRCEESPARYKGMTGQVTYKGETWGSVADKKRGHYVMCPIYDWSYTDVWKAIHAHGWAYNRLYDHQYRYGIELRKMRCSSVTHETSMSCLFYLQEVEPDTWNRMTARLQGVNSVGQLQEAFTTPPGQVPWMFNSWKEYRDHLVANLAGEADRPYFEKTFARYDALYDEACAADPAMEKDVMRRMIKCVLTGDVFGQRLGQLRSLYGARSKNAGARGGQAAKTAKSNQLVSG